MYLFCFCTEQGSGDGNAEEMKVKVAAEAGGRGNNGGDDGKAANIFCFDFPRCSAFHLFLKLIQPFCKGQGSWGGNGGRCGGGGDRDNRGTYGGNMIMSKRGQR